MQHLLEDSNSRVRLIAASAILATEPANVVAGAVLVNSLNDPVILVREGALVLLDSLGEGGSTLIEATKATNELCRVPVLA